MKNTKHKTVVVQFSHADHDVLRKTAEYSGFKSLAPFVRFIMMKDVKRVVKEMKNQSSELDKELSDD